jgi:hypothetical protein
MRQIVLKFGLIAGAIMSVMMFVTLRLEDKLDIGHGGLALLLGYTTMVVAFLMVYFGVRSYRDNVSAGKVTFGRALVVGLMITMVASVCYVATWEFIYYKLTPDFADKYAAAAVEHAKKSGATEAQIAATTKEMEEFKVAYKNPLINIAYTLIEPLPVGILFTLIAAGVLSRKRKGDGTAAA